MIHFKDTEKMLQERIAQVPDEVWIKTEAALEQEEWWETMEPIDYKQKILEELRERRENSKYSREEAIRMAEAYGLQQEVTDAIDTYGMAPDDALKEWDLCPGSEQPDVELVKGELNF